MNRSLPTNVLFQGSMNELRRDWIEKIFERLIGLYGARFFDQWTGTDLDSVKLTWAERLGGFNDHPLAIKEALDALDEKPWPPTLPEFLTLCREAAKRTANATPLLKHTPTQQERDRANQAAREAGKAVKKENSDHLWWAKRPKSQAAVNLLIEGAKTDVRLKDILNGLIEAGVVSEAGKFVGFGLRRVV